MQFLARWLILIGAIAGLAACASFKAPQNNPEAQLPYRHSPVDLNVAWNIAQSGNDMVIDGIINNIRNLELQDIELTFKILDSGGRLLSGGFIPVPIPLKMNVSIPFSFRLMNDSFAQGDVLDLIIRYHANDDDRQ